MKVAGNLLHISSYGLAVSPGNVLLAKAVVCTIKFSVVMAS